jgi:hypothetical protein
LSGKGRGNEAHDARLPNTLLQRVLRFVSVGNHPVTSKRELGIENLGANLI